MIAALGRFYLSVLPGWPGPPQTGATSGLALAGVVGPLVEVAVLVALVYVFLALRTRLFRTAPY